LSLVKDQHFWRKGRKKQLTSGLEANRSTEISNYIEAPVAEFVLGPSNLPVLAEKELDSLPGRECPEIRC